MCKGFKSLPRKTFDNTKLKIRRKKMKASFQIKLAKIKVNFGKIKNKDVDVNLMYTIIYPKEGIADAKTIKIEEKIKPDIENPIKFHSEEEQEEIRRSLGDLKDDLNELTHLPVSTELKNKFKKLVGDEIYEQFDKLSKKRTLGWKYLEDPQNFREESKLIDFDKLIPIVEKVRNMPTQQERETAFREAWNPLIDKEELRYMKDLIDLKFFELSELPIKKLLYQSNIHEDAYLDILITPVEKSDGSEKKKGKEDVLHELAPSFVGLIPGMNFVIQYFFTELAKSILKSKSKDIIPAKGSIKLTMAKLTEIYEKKEKLLKIKLYAVNSYKASGTKGLGVGTKPYRGHNTILRKGHDYGEVVFEVTKL
jgi:hypothetical protein